MSFQFVLFWRFFSPRSSSSRIKIFNLKGIQHAFNAMKQYPENEKFLVDVCYLMYWMVELKSCIDTINTLRGELIENAMKQYPNNSDLQIYGKGALDKL